MRLQSSTSGPGTNHWLLPPLLGRSPQSMRHAVPCINDRCPVPLRPLPHGYNRYERS